MNENEEYYATDLLKYNKQYKLINIGGRKIDKDKSIDDREFVIECSPRYKNKTDLVCHIGIYNLTHYCYCGNDDKIRKKLKRLGYVESQSGDSEYVVMFPKEDIQVIMDLVKPYKV